MISIDEKKLNKAIKSKYSIENNTFTFKPKDIDKDRIETEIGDIKQPEFHPQVKIKRWDNEVNFSVRLKHEEENPEIFSIGENIKWKGKKIEIDFYDLKEGEGGYEFEVTLKEKPKTNKVEFSLNTKGVDFFYQPELTIKEILRGYERPENVVGSYAIYCSEERINIKGQKEYKSGKVGHIYRPRIEDSKGDWIWGKLNIDKEKEILYVEIPQEFLDNAEYPIRHAAGLTFGNTSAGASSGNFSKGTLTGNAYAGAAGSGDSMSIYAEYYNGTGRVKLGLYLHSNDSLVGNTGELTLPTSAGWVTGDFVSSPDLSAVNYKVVTFVGGSGEENARLHWDNVTAARYQQSGLTYGTFPDPFTYTTYDPDSIKFSVYVTYELPITFIPQIMMIN